ncbi:hypothetical protein SODALDRAFT_175675 [Sodiomyces alkalinus F11]|uniref:Uncharacterized protein n=1 Tax=Sodiomyces alkalinus (strain CBS 110278 / VKM F-3762 / F11) TaxID=1314773 RepID=A0A3N2PU56_SODAK|nr:hypothetical protein SODALDRAFT_175675 [Sodiomyces alkalinus F11]ROT37856.1 hypothetical protein SODALDRAFT_175675 [Sodiomyces alkalinus F11]
MDSKRVPQAHPDNQDVLGQVEREATDVWRCEPVVFFSVVLGFFLLLFFFFLSREAPARTSTCLVVFSLPSRPSPLLPTNREQRFLFLLGRRELTKFQSQPAIQWVSAKGQRQDPPPDCWEFALVSEVPTWTNRTNCQGSTRGLKTECTTTRDMWRNLGEGAEKLHYTRSWCGRLGDSRGGRSGIGQRARCLNLLAWGGKSIILSRQL